MSMLTAIAVGAAVGVVIGAAIFWIGLEAEHFEQHLAHI